MHIYTLIIFFTCLLVQKVQAYDVLIQSYVERQNAHKRNLPVNEYTSAINSILASENLINPNLHDMDKKKKVMQAVMASVILHKNSHLLSNVLPNTLSNPALKNHFEILKLTEKIARSMIAYTYSPEDFEHLNVYSGIKKDSFFNWFDEVCAEHNIASPTTRINEQEQRNQRLITELSMLRQGLEQINLLERQVDRDTLARSPHAYDGNVPGWANQLWSAFTALNPPNVPTAEFVEQRILAAAKKNNTDGLIASRYSHLRGAGFGGAQNLLQQIVGWNMRTDNDYATFRFALIPEEGSPNSAMYNAFIFPAIGTVQGLYEGRIQAVERELRKQGLGI